MIIIITVQGATLTFRQDGFLSIFKNIYLQTISNIQKSTENNITKIKAIYTSNFFFKKENVTNIAKTLSLPLLSSFFSEVTTLPKLLCISHLSFCAFTTYISIYNMWHSRVRFYQLLYQMYHLSTSLSSLIIILLKFIYPDST